MTYYLIQTKPREEQRAQLHLANQGYVCYLPLRTIDAVRSGRRISRVEPLFPRYRLDHEKDNWSRIRSTRGVSHLVRFGVRCASVDDDFIEQLSAQIAAGQAEPQYQSGQVLRIVQGPFKGLEAVFREPDGEARVVVLLNML